MTEVRTVPMYIAGVAQTPNSVGEVLNKYSGTVIARHPLAGDAEIDRAVRAAHAARHAMHEWPRWKRREALMGLVRALSERRESVAQTITAESGKLIGEARLEVDRACETFRLAAEQVDQPSGLWMDLDHSARSERTGAIVRRFPIGVVSLITPFNFPLNLAAHKVAPAIAAGCPFLLKPAPRTPLSSLLLGELLQEAQLPSGAYSVLPCTNEMAHRLVTHDLISLVSFTGSARVGWMIRSHAGTKRVVLELGGNAACIVDEGADAQRVADRIVKAAYFQAGQSCISVQRVLIHRTLFEPLSMGIVEGARALKSGDPCDERTTLGTMIDEHEAERIESWVAVARDAGASILCGGSRTGAYVAATVLRDVPHSCEIWAEEAFGPVVCIEPFDDFEAALDVVNQSRYGLQAGVFTHDMRHVMLAFERLEVGGVIINDVPSFRADAMPYGGVKASGLGREGIRSAMEHMTEERILVLRPS